MNALLLDPEGRAELGEVDARRVLAINVAAVAGVVLTAGHADRTVVEQQHG